MMLDENGTGLTGYALILLVVLVFAVVGLMIFAPIVGEIIRELQGAGLM